MSWCHIYCITSVILYIYSGDVTASEYYVSVAPNGESCPYDDLPCHNFSYYIANYLSYFTDDAIFYLLEGTHTLQGILNISNVSNITLQGLGHIEQGFHETVMQSTSVIRCSVSKRTGIQFSSSSNVALKSLTITDCGFNWNQQYSVSLYFVNIDNVTLEYVSVQNGSGDGVFIRNSYDVLIANSSFANNITQEYFLANVYIVNNDHTNRLSKLTILESNFTLYFGSGIYLWYGDDHEADVNIRNSMFSHNNGWYAGGVYITLLGGGSIEFSNCTICNNTAYNGGGMCIRSYKNGSIEFSNCNIYNNSAIANGGGVNAFSFDESSIKFSNCIIYNNTAQSDGGGVHIDSHAETSSIEFSNCTISNNTAYFASGLLLRSVQVNLEYSFLFTNVSFRFNEVIRKIDVYQKGYQSAVVVINVNNVTFDQLEVSNHNTTGLVAENSLLTFDRNNTFVNNSGIYGGGIALYKSSQLLLEQNTNISFINNHASESGGGIFIYHDQVLATDCFFRVIPYHNLNDTKTVLYFVNNTADISGDVLYINKVEDCINTLYFNHLFHYPHQTGLSVVSSDPIQACFCETNRKNCSIKSISIFAMPGINVNISLATVGIHNSLTKGVINLISDSSSATVLAENTRINAGCTNVIFKLTANPSIKTTRVRAILQRSISEHFYHLYEHYDKVINVNIESCPIGYPLVNDICICRPELKTCSITCNVNTQLIRRHDDMWIGYENDSNCLIVYHNCPFDYCNEGTVIFNITSPEPQCLLNRSGTLCGQCAEGLSLMLGSNQCRQCTNNYIFLIIPFASAGIALVAFVIALNLTVSVGTINGLIFYANVVKMFEHIFFPKYPVMYLSQFISWINLDLDIETCFIHGLGSCTKTWLQFIFPAYVWLILLLIIILSKYSSKVVRLFGKQIIPVLATMILLSYAKLIRIVFQVLHYTKIQCDGDNNVTLLRWYIDANVQYVQGCHIPLFLFSLAVLIFLIVPYTLYLLTIPLFEGPLSKYMCCFKRFSTYIKPFFDAYGGPYKDKCRFWTGFLLLVRIIIALTVSVDTNATKSSDVLLSLLIVIIFMYLIFKGIYRHIPLDYLEEFFILNLMLMAYMNVRTTNDNDKLKGQVSSIILVSISFVIFCGIIFYHVWDHLLKSYLQQQITNIKNRFKKLPPSSTSNDMELPFTRSDPSDDERPIPILVVSIGMKQESMLFDKDDQFC